jgi:hypothetical protein
MGLGAAGERRESAVPVLVRLTRTSRAFDPSCGPTIPACSSTSMTRPAAANPIRSLRCSIDVDPNCVVMTMLAASRSSSGSTSGSGSGGAPASSVTSVSWRPAGTGWIGAVGASLAVELGPRGEDALPMARFSSLGVKGNRTRTGAGLVSETT